MKIDLNCDLGEGVGNDEAIMPFITSANIACGLHAGDPAIMRTTIRLAKRYRLNIGAHPSWDDRENFGRREMNLSVAEAESIVFDQIHSLAETAKSEDVLLSHVKPHGALYNQAARDIDLANVIVHATKRFGMGKGTSPILIGLAGSKLCEAGESAGLKVIREGFPDRAYNKDGSLMLRSQIGAVIEDPHKVASNAVMLVQSGRVDTLCLHGDHPQALENAKLVAQILIENHITLEKFK
jgi:UPF0271 protein